MPLWHKTTYIIFTAVKENLSYGFLFNIHFINNKMNTYSTLGTIVRTLIY